MKNATVSARSPKSWPAHAFHERDGEEDGDRRERRGRHGAADLARAAVRRAHWIVSFLLAAEDALKAPRSSLSTSIPTPRASPPRDMMLNEMPRTYMGMKVAITEMGMARPTTAVAF